MKKNPLQVTRYADMFSAMGTESRLRIMQLLLSAHPDGMVVGEILEELGISASNLSHHLDKLKNQELITVTRAGTFLRCTANTRTLQELLGFRSGRTGDFGVQPLAPSRQAQEPGTHHGDTGRHLSAVHRQHPNAAGITRLPLCRMLHPEPSREAGNHRYHQKIRNRSSCQLKASPTL